MYLSCSYKFLGVLCYIAGLKDFCHVCHVIDKPHFRIKMQNNWIDCGGNGEKVLATLLLSHLSDYHTSDWLERRW